jgi:hypothetical protein
LLNVDNENMRATADLLLNRLKLQKMLQNDWLSVAWAFAVTAGNGLYKISPKEARGRFSQSVLGVRVGARPWLASTINSALLIAFKRGSLSLGGIGIPFLTPRNWASFLVTKELLRSPSSQVLVAHTYNPRDQEDYGSKPTLAK